MLKKKISDFVVLMCIGSFLVLFNAQFALASQNNTNVMDLSLTPSLKRNISIGDINKLDGQIKILKKKIKVQELKNKLESLQKEEEEDSSSSEPSSPIKKNMSPKIPKQPPGTSSRAGQQRGVPSSTPAGTKGFSGRKGKPLSQRPASPPNKGQKEVDARIVSVSGFGQDVKAEVDLASGGIVTVYEGDSISSLGEIDTITSEKVEVVEDDETYNIPFKSEDDEQKSPTLPAPSPPSPSGVSDSTSFTGQNMK